MVGGAVVLSILIRPIGVGIPRRFETGALFRCLVTNILLPTPATNSEPPEPATNGFDEVPGVEDIQHGVYPKGTAAVRSFWVGEVTRGGFGSDYLGAADVVHFPGEGPEMEDGEDGHFDTEEEGGDADFDVRVGNAGGGFDGAGGGEEGYDDLGLYGEMGLESV